MQITMGWREGKAEILFTGYRISDPQDKNVLEISFTTMWIYLTPLNHMHLKWLKNIDVMSLPQ